MRTKQEMNIEHETDNERVVDVIVENTRSLLNDHWDQILEYRRTVESTISFSHRVKDTIEESIDLDQIPLGI